MQQRETTLTSNARIAINSNSDIVIAITSSVAEEVQIQCGFLRQISADTALKSLAIRQYYSPFCLVSTKICSWKTALHLNVLFFCAVWCFFGETILTYSETKSAAMCEKTTHLGTLNLDFFSQRSNRLTVVSGTISILAYLSKIVKLDIRCWILDVGYFKLGNNTHKIFRKI